MTPTSAGWDLMLSCDGCRAAATARIHLHEGEHDPSGRIAARRAAEDLGWEVVFYPPKQIGSLSYPVPARVFCPLCRRGLRRRLARLLTEARRWLCKGNTSPTSC